MPYAVWVDDNFHFGDIDQDERYCLGEFSNCADAVEACKSIVDQFLRSEGADRTPTQLFSYYRSFGEDPFIRSDDPTCKFSAWTYAKARCQDFAGKREPD
jgi:hypothetical protein